MLKNKFTKYKDQFDSIESTYKHLIYTNQGKKYILTGYSKGDGLPERKDKEILIQKVVLRLINRGYLQKSDKIEFYKKNYIDNRHDQLLFIMYPDRFEYTDSIVWIIPFLEKVYENILQKNKLEESIIIDRAKGFKKIGLDIEFFKDSCFDLECFKNKLSELKANAEIPENILHKFYYTYENDFKK